ncbi:hypothetical protein D9M69_587020 [compost metagenome]
MYVQAENEIAPGHIPHFIDQLVIAVVFGDQLMLPVRKRVCSCRHNLQPLVICQLQKLLTQKSDFLPGLLDIGTNVGPHFYHRLVHFLLNSFLKDDPPAFHYFRHVAFQLSCFGVDGLKLFFNPQGKQSHRYLLFFVATFLGFSSLGAGAAEARET